MNSFVDEDWMLLAVEAAQNHRGWSSPRPCVGCVVVRDNQLLGTGWTQAGNGRPHAEIMAIRAAWNTTRLAARAVRRLTPRSNRVRTGARRRLLRRAHSRSVRARCGRRGRPRFAVSGRGVKRLRAAGIIVDEGILARESFRAMDDFCFTPRSIARSSRLKAPSRSMENGQLPGGESKWITGAASREIAQQLRHQSDAILVGIETVLHDDPQLSRAPN
jgi:diaminohydroxyphosphoribosylaminopyrimidine deaminase/5-amino-6-(5-phosphoribosylamino)uracil reductase